jgi:hypothetical protein
MRTLILNSSNILPNTNNSVLKYNFPAGNVEFVKGQKIALANLSMFYSTFNITATYGNNKIGYKWVDNTEITITIPDGFYDITDLNNYIHQIMIYNGHYLVNNDTSQFVYFITIGSNASSYTFEINCFPMNATTYVIGTGTGKYTLGTKQTGSTAPTWVVPTANIVPMLHIYAGQTDLLGFKAGYYPLGSPTYLEDVITGTPPAQTQATAYSVVQAYTSSSVPQITPLSSFVLTCSLLNNNYAVPNSLLYAFAPVGTFGNQFQISPSGQFSFIDCQPGQYASFTMTFLDQSLRPVAIQDPNVVILIVITDPVEQTSK